jgi:rare lipoprotein A
LRSARWRKPNRLPHLLLLPPQRLPPPPLQRQPPKQLLVMPAKAMTMAHKTLPFGTLVKVTNLKTKRSVVVRVNDRGPSTPDRIGDVSSAAATKLKMRRSGVIDAKLEVVGMKKMGKGKKAVKRVKKASN